MRRARLKTNKSKKEMGEEGGEWGLLLHTKWVQSIMLMNEPDTFIRASMMRKGYGTRNEENSGIMAMRGRKGDDGEGWEAWGAKQRREDAEATIADSVHLANMG
jgi:hypothetical protein